MLHSLITTAVEQKASAFGQIKGMVDLKPDQTKKEDSSQTSWKEVTASVLAIPGRLSRGD